ncbi:MAG: nuclear transport factor 2 family protein [Rhodoferax sp.]|nr:nuclear transport factor 2 family protein [Rhodoferax sp.]
MTVARPRHDDPRVARVVDAFEALAPDTLDALCALYADDARFKDPFNDVRGHAALRRVFAHMFRSLDEPRFEVLDAVVQADQCFLTWDFRFRMKRFDRGTQTIHGSTHLRFGADGRITLHRDYWDAAEELYEKLPLVGALMRWFKRRAGS